MTDTADPIGSIEFRQHQAEYLRQVERGRSFTLTVHGRPVARVVPLEEQPAGAMKSLPDGEPT